MQVLNSWQAGMQSHLAYIGFDFGPGVLNLVLQQGVIHHLLQLIPDGVTKVARRPSICQVVVPAGKHHCGEGEQLVAVHKATVALTLRLQIGCVCSSSGGAFCRLMMSGSEGLAFSNVVLSGALSQYMQVSDVGMQGM